MSTHISETENLRKSENKTNIQLLKNAENSVRSNEVSQSLYEGPNRQLEKTEENSTRTRHFGHFASGICFVCDPDWCPDYRRRSCGGKGLR